MDWISEIMETRLNPLRRGFILGSTIIRRKRARIKFSGGMLALIFGTILFSELFGFSHYGYRAVAFLTGHVIVESGPR